jgi:hypothetical protein
MGASVVAKNAKGILGLGERTFGSDLPQVDIEEVSNLIVVLGSDP